jgi:hypothetical protein
MRTNGFIRLVLGLLLVSQLASAYALVPRAHGAHAPAATAHCARHGNPSAPAGTPSSSGHCCEQPAGCHCPQVPALQQVAAISGVASSDVAPPVPLRAPPPQLRTEELFRPPI